MAQEECSWCRCFRETVEKWVKIDPWIWVKPKILASHNSGLSYAFSLSTFHHLDGIQQFQVTIKRHAIFFQHYHNINAIQTVSQLNHITAASAKMLGLYSFWDTRIKHSHTHTRARFRICNCLFPRNSPQLPTVWLITHAWLLTSPTAINKIKACTSKQYQSLTKNSTNQLNQTGCVLTLKAQPALAHDHRFWSRRMTLTMTDSYIFKIEKL